MTTAATTGLNAPNDALRAFSTTSGIVTATAALNENFAVTGPGVSIFDGFRSGEDQIVLPAGIDLSAITVRPDWEGDAWGMRVSYGEDDSVFLRWSWQFDAEQDLALSDGTTQPGDGTTQPDDGTTQPGDGNEGGIGSGGDGTTPAPSGDITLGSGADALVLKVSSDAYQGDAQFIVHVNGQQVGGVMTATAAHGESSNTITLHGDWGSEAQVAVTFVNDLWEGSAEADRNLHIDGASYNGTAIEGAAQTVWGDYSVDFTAGASVGVPPVEGGKPDDNTIPPVNGGAEPGMTLVLSDDFSNGYNYDNWGWPFGGGVYWNNAFSWNSDDVAVRDGEMQVSMTKQADGWWTAGGFNSFKADNTILYGKIEFDAKVPEAQGTMAAILTWPGTDVWPRDGEIDILETPHNENMFSSHYEGPDGEHWYNSIRSSTFDASEWNHYEMTWLPDSLTIAVNGEVVAQFTDPSEIPTVPHGFGAMGFVGGWADQWMGGAPDGSTPDQVIISLDNVKMYQLDGVL